MKHSQNQVVEGLGLEFAPQEGRITAIENSVLAATRRVRGSSAHEQLKQHLRFARQQRLEANDKYEADNFATVSSGDIYYYRSIAEQLRAEAAAEFFSNVRQWLKKVISTEKTEALEVESNWPNHEQILNDVARGELLRAETVAESISKFGSRVKRLFNQAPVEPVFSDTKFGAFIQDDEILRQIEHAGELRSVLLADAIVQNINTVSEAFAKVFKKIQHWHQQRLTWRELQGLSDYVLRDIGVSRQQLKNFSKEVERSKSTWVDQVNANQADEASVPEVVNIEQTAAPAPAANDDHRDLAA